VEACRLRLMLEVVRLGGEPDVPLGVEHLDVADDPAAPPPPFQVIVGNPPYVEQRRSGGATPGARAGNLAGVVLERSLALLEDRGWLGMVLPVGLISTGRAAELRTELRDQCTIWASSFSNRPAKLIPQVEQRHTVLLAERDGNPERASHSAGYHHFTAAERPKVMEHLAYVAVPDALSPDVLAKISGPVHRSIIEALAGAEAVDPDPGGPWRLYFHDGPTYWIRALNFPPNRGSSRPISSHYQTLGLPSEAERDYRAAVLNSSLFYLHFKTFSNCRDLTRADLARFPFLSPTAKVVGLAGELMAIYRSTAKVRARRYPSGRVEYDEYYPAASKPVIDEIDWALGAQYGLSQERIAFVIGYDEDYRMSGRGGVRRRCGQ
jgi:hypothetical protein